MTKRILYVFLFLISTPAYSAWDVEKTQSFKGEIRTYLVKTNKQGHKLVIDEYNTRLIFVQQDKTYRREINGIKIDGEYLDATADRIDRHPDLTVIWFNQLNEENMLKIIEKAKKAKRIEINVDYFREGERVSVFEIK